MVEDWEENSEQQNLIKGDGGIELGKIDKGKADQSTSDRTDHSVPVDITPHFTSSTVACCKIG